MIQVHILFPPHFPISRKTFTKENMNTMFDETLQGPMKRVRGVVIIKPLLRKKKSGSHGTIYLQYRSLPLGADQNDATVLLKPTRISPKLRDDVSMRTIRSLTVRSAILRAGRQLFQYGFVPPWRSAFQQDGNSPPPRPPSSSSSRTRRNFKQLRSNARTSSLFSPPQHGSLSRGNTPKPVAGI